MLDFLATVFLVCTARLGFRLYREELRPVAPEGVRRVLIVGAGDAAEAIVREIHRMRVERYLVVGMVDDDPAKRSITIHGVPVLGTTEDIRKVCEEDDIEEIIIAMPSASQKELRRVIDLCSGTKLKFQSLPGVSDLINGRVTVSQMRAVDISDLLGSEAVELEPRCRRQVPPRQTRPHHRRRRVDRLGNVPPGRQLRPGQAHPARTGRDPPVRHRERAARKARRRSPSCPCICDIFDRNRVLAVWKQHRPGGRHPRRRPQARAHDGAQPLRGHQEQHPRHQERRRRVLHVRRRASS